MKQNVKRNRSKEICKYIVTHYIINDIPAHNSGNITNVVATSGRGNIDITPQYHSSAQQLNANVEKTDDHADAFNNQTVSTHKQSQTTINYNNSSIIDYLNSAAPYVVLAAAALVVSSIIKERA